MAIPLPCYLVWHVVRKHWVASGLLGTLLICTIILTSHRFLLVLIWSFVIGIVSAYYLLSPETSIPNILLLHARKKKGSARDDDLALRKIICAVCGQRKCPRHRPELNLIAFQPWTNLTIPAQVDEAIEEFLNIVLKDFVYTWYKNIGEDEEFVDELKTSIRFIAAVLLRRAKKLDIPYLVTKKLTKAFIQHIDCYLRAKQRASHGRDIQDIALDEYGADLHRAMYSRKAEVEYLRRLVESLFPYLLKPQALRSKTLCALVREIFSGSLLIPAFDAIANPDMVNNLILVFLDRSPPPVDTDPVHPPVEILSHFSQPLCKTNSCLHLRISDVMDRKNTQLLFAFMQFLKTEAAVNVLQFTLQCEDFNNRILNPDLSQSQLAGLHSMAKELYRCYCAPDALDRIHFDDNVIRELREITEGPIDQILRLRRMNCLYRAYEHAYNLLENTFLPLFHQSDDYYTVLCGSRIPSKFSRSSSSLHTLTKPNNIITRTLVKKQSSLIHIGNKIKEVFRANTIEGKPDVDDEFDRMTVDSSSSMDDEIPDYMCNLSDDEMGDEVHDLSSWRITVPRIGARPDPENMKKQYFVFIIDVRRVDMRDDVTDHSRRSNWVVARKYTEFYVLEQKLKEFHGESLVCQLPPKKSFGTKNHNFIDGKREVFEQYLQKLLENSALKGSELLYRFLTSNTEFNTGILPDIKLGKMIKTVPMLLLKEKGQHLETFLHSFETSAEAPKPRPSKLERRGSDSSFRSNSSCSDKLCSSLYENNANIPTNNSPAETTQQPVLVETTGVYDVILYIASHVYLVPDWFHHVLIMCQILLKHTLESYVEWYIDFKVTQVLQQHRIVSLVHLLRDVLFFDSDPPRTDDEKRDRYHQTFTEAKDFIPKVCVHVIGEDQLHDGTKLILELLQKPRLNKQLMYVLLDMLVLELFPELGGTTPTDVPSDD